MQGIDFRKIMREFLNHEDFKDLKEQLTKNTQDRHIKEEQEEKERQKKLYQEAIKKGFLD